MLVLLLCGILWILLGLWLGGGCLIKTHKQIAYYWASRETELNWWLGLNQRGERPIYPPKRNCLNLLSFNWFVWWALACASCFLYFAVIGLLLLEIFLFNFLFLGLWPWMPPIQTAILCDGGTHGKCADRFFILGWFWVSCCTIWRCRRWNCGYCLLRSLLVRPAGSARTIKRMFSNSSAFCVFEVSYGVNKWLK